MRALIHDPAVRAVTVGYRYAGVVGPDGLTRSDYELIGTDANGAEIGRVHTPAQTYRLMPALNSEITRAGFVRAGDPPSGGLAGTVDYTRP